MSRRTCGSLIQAGPRRGHVCGRTVSEVIVWSDASSFPVFACGNHARAYLPAIRYPLWANLATIRRFQAHAEPGKPWPDPISGNLLDEDPEDAEPAIEANSRRHDEARRG